MVMTLSMAPLHSLGQDYQNEVKYDCFGHTTPMVLASVAHDTNSIIMVSLHLLGQDGQNEVGHDFLLM